MSCIGASWWRPAARSRCAISARWNPLSPSLGRRLPARTCIRIWRAKATALAFSLLNNHPFVDGNKRVGHAALETLLMLNGYELDASVDAGEQIILAVAAGRAPREELLGWVRTHLKTTGP